MMPTEPPNLKGVIVCADDFAVHESASRGIAQLATMSRLSATSVMTLSPRWAQDVALLQDLRDRIDVGLHLDWTSDFAIAAGHGLSLNAAMLKALLGGFDKVAARTVIERQLDAFEAHWKAPPDYVDGHQHVQQFAGIREALVAALVSRYGRADEGGNGAQVKPNGAARERQPLPYLRISRAPSGTADLKSHIIAAMGASAIEKVAAHAYLTGARGLLGIYNFADSRARYAQLMDGWLNAAPTGSIIMCHPALTAEPGDVIGPARAQEFGYLMSDDLPEALERAGVELVRGAAVFGLNGN